MKQNDILDLVTTLPAEEASVQALFGGEGRGAHSIRSRNQKNPEYQTKLAEAARIFAAADRSKRGMVIFQEALGTSDFPNIFADVLDRMLYAGYKEVEPVYQNYIRVNRNIRDFRPVKRFAIYGSDEQLSLVPPQTEYPQTQLTDLAWTYSVNKYGKSISLSWEDEVNDDLGALTDIPARQGRGARRTEQRFATGLYTDVNGPHIGLYNAGNKNLVNIANGAVTNNPVLSVDALTDAVNVLLNQVDEQGEPIDLGTMRLVVPQGLMVKARQIMTATMLIVNAAGTVSATGQRVEGANYLTDFMEGPYVDRYITAIATSRAAGSLPWFLFGDPNESRPAAEMGFLAAYPEPQLFVKDPNQTRVGGGAVDPLDGDFDFDAVRYKVRHVMGGTRMDGRRTVASRGDGLA